MDIEIVPTGARAVSALAIGSVIDTIAGRIDPRLKERFFKAADYSFGFEAASPRGSNAIGESVLLNGTCYATSTEEGSDDYGKIIWGDAFVTGGMFLLPKEAQPTHLLKQKRAIRFNDLISKIYASLDRPLAFVGTCKCETLYTMAIGKPPIHGLPIFENRDYYFPKPHQTLQNEHCFFMGIIASFSDEKRGSLNKLLELVLYKNPFDQQSSLSSHTHCLVLNRAVPIGEITPKYAQKCLHVFTDKTVVEKATFSLYTLDSISSLFN